MMGMEMLLKNMLGVDPEQMRQQVEQFMAGINAKLEQGVQSYQAIDARLKRIEDAQAVIFVMLRRIMEEMMLDHSTSAQIMGILAAPPTLEDVDAIHAPVNGSAP